MSNQICILDFSGPNIITRFLTIDQPSSLQLEQRLPFEIGYVKEKGQLLAYFEDDFKKLNPNKENVAKFAELATYFKRIDDYEVITQIFTSYLEEIIKRLTTEIGGDIGEMKLYVCIPYNWSVKHRSGIREAAQRFPKLDLKYILNEHICLIAHYLCSDEEGSDLGSVLETKGIADILFFDFRSSELKVLHVACTETETNRKFAIKDLKVYPRYRKNIGKVLEKDIGAIIKAIYGRIFYRGFGVNTERKAEIVKDFFESLQVVAPDRSLEGEGIFVFVPDDTTIARGAESFISLLNQAAQSEKSTSFECRFLFGIQLDADKIYELIPRNHKPLPIKCRKAFRAEGNFDSFNVNLYCGFSNSIASSILLESIQVHPDESSKQEGWFDFIVAIDLEDETRGQFAILCPRTQPPVKSFRVPTLIE